MNEKEKIIIIGCVAAGSKCAFKLKRERPEFDITIYTMEDTVSYSACGLPYYIGGQIKSSENLIVRRPEDYKKAGLNLFLKHKLVSINSAEKSVKILDIDTGRYFEDKYDKLVLATGAKPFVPKIENKDLENVFTLRNVYDGIKIKEQMLKSKTAVIIGGGYIGIELLESFTRNGLQVKLIEFANHIMNLFDLEMAERIEKHILTVDSDKVEIIRSSAAVKFLGNNGKVQKVVINNGREIETDMVVICVGVEPITDYLEGSGITTGVKGAIKINKNLQTNIPDIYAIGDCSENTNLITGKPCWIPLGSTANKEGRCCAINLAGEKEEFQGVLGSAVTRYHGFTMSITGLTEREAIAEGYEVVTETITKKDKAGYMPEVKNITIKVVVDKKTKKILGAQAIGCGDADKRVNTVTSAIVSGKSVDDFVNLDMTYAPPYSPSIDPLLTALANVQQKLDTK